MLHRLTGYQGLDACDLTLTHNIQLARCKFYTVGTFHTTMVTILYWYAPVHSKRPVGREVAFTQGRGIETNPANRSRIDSKFGWYGKVNQKSGRFANVPFHSGMNIKGRSVQVHFPDLLGSSSSSSYFIYSWLVRFLMFL